MHHSLISCLEHSVDLQTQLGDYVGIRNKLAGLVNKKPPQMPAPSIDPQMRLSVQPAVDGADSHHANIATQPEGTPETPVPVSVPSETALPTLEQLASTSTEQNDQPQDVLGTGPTGPHAPKEDAFGAIYLLNCLFQYSYSAIDDDPILWNATRTMLPHIAWLTDEIYRTAEEKINLAQTVYEVVRFCLSAP